MTDYFPICPFPVCLQWKQLNLFKSFHALTINTPEIAVSYSNTCPIMLCMLILMLFLILCIIAFMNLCIRGWLLHYIILQTFKKCLFQLSSQKTPQKTQNTLMTNTSCGKQAQLFYLRESNTTLQK